jgi:acyl dehydratase
MKGCAMTALVCPRTLADLEGLIGQKIGPTAWHEVTQEEINRFADLTGDHQWIHVDPERAANGPFGVTIAHGLYGLALSPGMSGTLMDHSGFAHSLNYGYNKVRFTSPLPVGSRIRLSMTIAAVEEVPAGGLQLRTDHLMEREGADKPVFVAESLARIILHES